MGWSTSERAPRPCAACIASAPIWPTCALSRERLTTRDPTALAGALGDEVPSAVVHRIVHGGSRFAAPCLVDEAVEIELDRLSELAPLHNPAALAWLRESRRLAPSATQV